MSPQVISDIASVQYRERFGLSYQQYLDEPVEEIAKAFLVWEKQALRDKLEAERQRTSAA